MDNKGEDLYLVFEAGEENDPKVPGYTCRVFYWPKFAMPLLLGIFHSGGELPAAQTYAIEVYGPIVRDMKEKQSRLI